MNSNISETPVTISAFIIGMLVTDIIADLANLLRIPIIPTDAAVPKTVEIHADRIAIKTVCFSASNISVLKARLAYQSSEKPSKTQTLEPLLKEKKTITIIGAYRKNTIRAM